MYIWAAISMGVIGSLHCVGMCGPILAATQQKQGRWTGEMLHHAGRLLTYATLGGLVGALGSSINMMGYQQGFSITIGTTLLAAVCIYPIMRKFKQLEASIGKLSIRLSSWVHRSGLSRNSMRFGMGIANGLLPCGLVYLALAGASSTFTPWDGALFMTFFGLGTLPALAAVGAIAKHLSLSLRSKARRLIPITMILMGGLLIARGLDLGVPYLSPKASVESAEITECE